MTRILRNLGLAALLGLTAALALPSESHAGWGRYRAVTSYSVPSVPVYTQRVVVHGAYRPAVAAPVVASAPVVVAPPLVVTPPQTTYYLPAAPVAVMPPAVVRQTVVARPTIFAPRVRATYYAPVVVAPTPVILP